VDVNTALSKQKDGDHDVVVHHENQSSTSIATLNIIEITPKYDGKSYCGRFRLSNKSNQTLHVNGYKSHGNTSIRATCLEGEVFQNNNWKLLRMAKDAIPLTIDVAPGATVEVFADLPFQETNSGAITARIRWSTLVSEGFGIDWQSDRKAGKFDLAKTAHIEKLRGILAKMGFKKDFLQKNDFWTKIIESICKRISSTSGFQPFHLNDIALPEIDVDDRIEYHVRSDNISDYENVYGMDIVLDSVNLPVNWLYDPRFTGVESQVIERESQHRNQLDITLGNAAGKIGYKLTVTYIPPTNISLPKTQNINELTKAIYIEWRHWCPKK